MNAQVNLRSVLPAYAKTKFPRDFIEYNFKSCVGRLRSANLRNLRKGLHIPDGWIGATNGTYDYNVKIDIFVRINENIFKCLTIVMYSTALLQGRKKDKIKKKKSPFDRQRRSRVRWLPTTASGSQVRTTRRERFLNMLTERVKEMCGTIFEAVRQVEGSDETVRAFFTCMAAEDETFSNIQREINKA